MRYSSATARSKLGFFSAWSFRAALQAVAMRSSIVSEWHLVPAFGKRLLRELSREIYLHAIREEQRRAVESVERLVFGPNWTQVQPSMQAASYRVNRNKEVNGRGVRI
jgi:hypothetical protein